MRMAATGMPTPTPILTPRSEEDVTGGVVEVAVAAAATPVEVAVVEEA